MWKLFTVFVLGITLSHSLGPIDERSVKSLPVPEIRQQQPTYRLPTNVRPSKYSLDILIDVDNDIFAGTVIINLDVTTATASIHLNYQDIEVNWSDAKLTLVGSTETFTVTSGVDRPVEQIYELHFNRNLAVGAYTLELIFSGAIQSDLTGLYKSSYTFTNGSLSETR